MRFRLCMKRHGGSGTNMTFEYADRMELLALRVEYDRLAKYLKDESDALKEPSTRSRR